MCRILSIRTVKQSLFPLPDNLQTLSTFCHKPSDTARSSTAVKRARALQQTLQASSIPSSVYLSCCFNLLTSPLAPPILFVSSSFCCASNGSVTREWDQIGLLIRQLNSCMQLSSKFYCRLAHASDCGLMRHRSVPKSSRTVSDQTLG